MQPLDLNQIIQSALQNVFTPQGTQPQGNGSSGLPVHAQVITVPPITLRGGANANGERTQATQPGKVPEAAAPRGTTQTQPTSIDL